MKDFFVSYTAADREWAEWIAWQLESEGYEVVIQAWDFQAGQNFVLNMDAALRATERLIAVLSAAYQDSVFAGDEWSAVMGTHDRTRIVPVRIEEFQPTGLLSAVSYIDLVGSDPAAARVSLLRGVQEGRKKPDREPRFPGHSRDSGEVAREPVFPGEVAERPWRLSPLLIHGLNHATDIGADPITLGWDPNNAVQLHEVYVTVSGQHCKVWLRDDVPVVRDLNSTNGTLVDGEPIDSVTPLKSGDVLELGPGGPRFVVTGTTARRETVPVSRLKTTRGGSRARTSRIPLWRWLFGSTRPGDRD
ncbi:MAG: TIR domain-containing protein [bacterium]|nr:TIR domain-containing protein [bacterium]